MKWKDQVSSLLAFALLSAYVYFYEIKGEKKQEG